MGRIAAGWQALSRSVEYLSKFFAYIAAFAIALSIVVLCREAVGRYFFDSPTSYTVPLVSILVVVILYCSVGYTASSDGHVSSDIFFDRMPVRAQGVVLLVGNLVAGLLGGLLLLQGLDGVQRSIDVDATLVEVFGIPAAIPQSLVPLGGGLLLLVAVVKAPFSVAQILTGRPVAAPQTVDASEEPLVDGGE